MGYPAGFEETRNDEAIYARLPYARWVKDNMSDRLLVNFSDLYEIVLLLVKWGWLVRPGDGGRPLKLKDALFV